MITMILERRAVWGATLLVFVAGCASEEPPLLDANGNLVILETGGAPAGGGGGGPLGAAGSSTGAGGSALGAGGFGSPGGGAAGYAPEATGGSVSGGGGSSTCLFGILCPVATGGTSAQGGMSGAGGAPSGGGGGAGGVNCDNAGCFDIFDCAIFHPDLLSCGFTKCEGLLCKK